MSSPLSPDELSLYTSIIDGILKTADLNTVTRKKIRAGLESKLGGKDLSTQKAAIKTLIEERFDRFTGPSGDDASDEQVKSEPSPPDTNDDDLANGHDEEEEAPARKKQKREVSTEDEDAKLAAQLQAQENNLARTRATRGGGTATKKRKAPRKKSAKKVQDDSDAEGSEEAPKRKAGGGFQKPFTLSYPLAQLVGEPQLSRPQVVKKLWIYIKANDLQDPKDKRQIRCDDTMQAVFKQARVDMFQMNKLIGNHLYPVEEEQ